MVPKSKVSCASYAGRPGILLIRNRTVSLFLIRRGECNSLAREAACLADLVLYYDEWYWES